MQLLQLAVVWANSDTYSPSSDSAQDNMRGNNELGSSCSTIRAVAFAHPAPCRHWIIVRWHSRQSVLAMNSVSRLILMPMFMLQSEAARINRKNIRGECMQCQLAV